MRHWSLLVVIACGIVAASGCTSGGRGGSMLPIDGFWGHGSGPKQIVLKPVDARGRTTSGFVEDDSRRDSTIDCSFGTPSPYDVGEGVRWCGGTADSGDACWPTANAADVLCLTDPFKNVLTLKAANGATTSLHAQEGPPRPMGIELDDGTECTARIGGAWDQQEPTGYIGYFGCSGGTVRADFLAVWASDTSDGGIAKGPDGWTVEVGDSKGSLTTLKVVKAYFVAVA